MSNTSVHAGIRCKLAVSRKGRVCQWSPLIIDKCLFTYHERQGVDDIENDQEVGFQLISTDDIDDLGIPEVVRRIRERVGDSPVYLRWELSLDHLTIISDVLILSIYLALISMS